jgi:hypothetical protein
MSGGSAILGGSVGSGMFGGGIGGGNANAEGLRLLPTIGCCCCPWGSGDVLLGGGIACADGLRLLPIIGGCCCSCGSGDILLVGLALSLVGDGSGGFDNRLPGTKEGVEATALIGRFDDRRKGAGLVRPCTDWRRECDVDAECIVPGLNVGE